MLFLCFCKAIKKITIINKKDRIKRILQYLVIVSVILHPSPSFSFENGSLYIVGIRIFVWKNIVNNRLKQMEYTRLLLEKH